MTRPSTGEAAGAVRRPLRRLAAELTLLVVLKIAFLSLLWWIAIAPYRRPDASPAAIGRLLAPSAAHSTSRPEAKP